MARKPKAATEIAQDRGAQAVDVAPGLFVLKKNHGLTLQGRTHKFYEAGTTFDPAKDGELISQLIQSGAALDEVAAKADPIQEVKSIEVDQSQGADAPESDDQNGTQE